jgi:hypothetical protein
VHPIERLRYVARASGGDPSVLVRETAGALASMGFDQAELVTACRRVVDRHLTVGPLWWLCARVLCAAEPRREAWACADEVEADETAEHLAWALPDDALVCVVGWPDLAGAALERKGDAEVLVVDSLGEGRGLVRHLQRVDVDAVAVPTHGLGAAAAAADVVLLECSAVGPSGAVCVSGSRAAAAVARHAGRRVWLVAGVGRVLPSAVFDAMVRRLGTEGPDVTEATDEVVPFDLVDAVAGPAGLEDPAQALLRAADCPVTPELFRPTAF